MTDTFVTDKRTGAIATPTTEFVNVEKAEGIAAFPDRRKPEWNHP